MSSFGPVTASVARYLVAALILKISTLEFVHSVQSSGRLGIWGSSRLTRMLWGTEWAQSQATSCPAAPSPRCASGTPQHFCVAFFPHWPLNDSGLNPIHP